jgi:N4-gp56 family major capsid protein
MADPMNLSPALAGLTPQIWDDNFFREYVRENQFASLMGADEAAVIQLKDDLERRRGDRVTFAFVGRLNGAGVRGHQVLRGNEEILNDRSMTIAVQPIRHAVAIDDWTAQQSVINKREAAKFALKDWIMELMRSDIINAFMSVATNVTFAQATPAQRDAWVQNNADRILFGGLRANTAGTAAASMANLTNAGPPAGAAPGTLGTSRMTKRMLELAKRQARAAHPRIRPYRTRNGVDTYVAYLHPLAFRDLRDDPEFRTDLQFAMERGKDNPLFTGGDLLTDGIVVKEEPEFATLTGAGGGGVDVAQSVLLGAQALGCAWAQRTVTKTDDYDYGFEHGVAVQEIRGIDKLRFGKGANDQDNLVDHGVFTMFSAIPADA